jgi:hypothetical protein
MRAFLAALWKPRLDPRALAAAARISVGPDARLDALARLIAIFPDEASIAVISGVHVVGVVVTSHISDRLPGARVVADVMHRI